MSAVPEAALRRLLDRAQIQDATYRYARGVDRGDVGLIRSAYHPDAYDASEPLYAMRVEVFGLSADAAQVMRSGTAREGAGPL
jgi:hypothetical protein